MLTTKYKIKFFAKLMNILSGFDIKKHSCLAVKIHCCYDYDVKFGSTIIFIKNYGLIVYLNQFHQHNKENIKIK